LVVGHAGGEVDTDAGSATRSSRAREHIAWIGCIGFDVDVDVDVVRRTAVRDF